MRVTVGLEVVASGSALLMCHSSTKAATINRRAFGFLSPLNYVFRAHPSTVIRFSRLFKESGRLLGREIDKVRFSSTKPGFRAHGPESAPFRLNAVCVARRHCWTIVLM